MGTWISHLRIAEKLVPHLHPLDETAFAFGSLAPDSGIPNATWTEFDPPKEVTHFLRKGEEEYAIHDLVYYRQYLHGVKPADDLPLYSFRLAYFFHLMCDILWAKRVWEATQRQFKRLMEADKRNFVSLVKGDWYGLDQLYVRDHPDHLFWRVIMAKPYPPSYLPFVNVDALYHQYDHIRRFYSQPEDEWFLSIPYRYLNETTMSRIVEDSVEAILITHEKLEKLKELDEFESSVDLMPETFLTPYEPPLGNPAPA